MEKKSSTLRLIYPQWQGACIAGLVPEVKDPDEASRGYYLGAELLNFLAPDNGQEIRVVPISTKAGERRVCDGVMDRDIIALQTEAALDILRECNPDRIVTLGGECSVSVVPFTYLADKYENDIAMIWIDAHPDITLPGDVYPGYHAMAVTACMGYGDEKIISKLPAKIDPSRILFVGLRDWERDEIKTRQEQYGIQTSFTRRCCRKQRCGCKVVESNRCVESGRSFRYGRARPGRNNSRRGCRSGWNENR